MWLAVVAHEAVEVEDAVEAAAGAYPLVDDGACGLVEVGPVAVAAEGGDGGAVDGEAAGMGFVDEALVGSDELLCGALGVGAPPDVVDAFEDDDVRHAFLLEYIAVEALGGGLAEASADDAVASDAEVEDASGALQAFGHDVGPAVLGIGGAAASVGDGVADDGDDGWLGCRRLVGGGGGDLDGGDVVPVVDALGGGEGLPRLEGAGHDIRGGARSAVRGGVLGCSAVADGDGEALQGSQMVGQGVAAGVAACLDGHAASSAEGQIAGRRGVDQRRVACVGDVDAADVDGVAAEDVAEAQPEPLAAERDVYDLSQRAIGEVGRARHIGYAGGFHGGGPCGDEGRLWAVGTPGACRQRGGGEHQEDEGVDAVHGQLIMYN